MNMRQCWNAICLHYGKPSMVDNKPVRIPREYDPVIGKDVADWLRAYKLKHEDFQPLFDKLKETYSATYGKLPDRACLQRASEALELLRGTSGELIPTRREEVTSDAGQAVLSQSDIEVGIGEVMMLAKHGKSVERRSPYKDD